TATSTADEDASTVSTSENVREELNELLRQKPSAVGTVLALDPTLLANDGYLATYPDLARFLAAHPDVRHNPNFYLSDYRIDRRGELDAVIEPVMILFMTILFAAAF